MLAPNNPRCEERVEQADSFICRIPYFLALLLAYEITYLSVIVLTF